MADKKLTAEQAAIVAAQVKPGEIAKIVAYAGTGKTSTFVAFSEARQDNMLYLAFNKSVAEEAKSKFPPNVRPKTIHALAYAQEGLRYAGKLGNVKYFNVARRFKDKKGKSLDTYAATLVIQTLENFQNSADFELTEKHAAEDVLQRFANKDLPTVLSGFANTVWKEQTTGSELFPMSHSGYLKLYQLSKPRVNARFIMLDEAQDTNPVTFDIVLRQREHGARILLTGDPYQQIYSWRGAVDAMKQAEDARKFYLTQSFRFGDEIANVANTILSTFFDETVPVRGSSWIDSRRVDVLPTGEPYTLLCRTNVEIFTKASDNCLKKVPVHIIGRENFGEFLETVMDVYYLYRGERHKIKNRQVAYFKGFEELKEFVEARLDMEMQAKVHVVEKYNYDIPKRVEAIATGTVPHDEAEIVFSTVHKAKGLEWDNVMLANDFSSIFEDEFQDGRGNAALIKPETQEERDEINMLYVACTRAKRHLKLNSELSYLHNSNQQRI